MDATTARPTLGASRAGPRRWLPLTAVVLLLGLFYVMAVSAAAGKSMTFDELAHLTGGYSYWMLDDYRLHPENGNLPQRLGALPAAIGGATFPRLDQPAWTKSDVYAIGDQFLYASGNDADRLLQRGRAVMALLGVALGALVYAWARRLVSPLGAWVSLLLFVFSPTLLAHDALVTSDMASALFFTAAAGALWVVLHRVTPLTVAGAGLLLGCAFLSKLSAPLLVPIAIVMLLVRLAGEQPLVVALGSRMVQHHGRVRQTAILVAVLGICAAITVAAVWAAFGFRYSAFAAATTGKDVFLGQIAAQPGLTERVLGIARRFHLLPEAYLYASSLTVQYSSQRAAFLNGAFSTTGWWWYFPYAFLVKTTIPALLAGVLAIVALARRWTRAEWYAATPLLALVGVYWIFALTTHLNIGHRHLLPLYPALCIFAGAAAFWLEPLLQRAPVAAPAARGRERRTPRGQTRTAAPVALWQKAAGVATLVLIAWHMGESLMIRPDYLAYFNQLAGGPAEGYTHLADSSLDWGQDLPALKQWLDEQGLQRPGATPVYLSYFGTARPEHYGIQATRLAGFVDRRPPQPPEPLGAGVYCVSATILDVIGRMFYTPEYEDNYQAAFKNLIAFARASEDERAWAALLQRTGERYWQDLFTQYDQLRTGRLTAFLRQRHPDAMVGYSILIYRLSDAEVEQALR